MHADDPGGGPPAAIVAALQELAEGRLSTKLHDPGDAWSPVVQAMKQIQACWQEERDGIVVEIAQGIQDLEEKHHRETRVIAERERRKRERERIEASKMASLGTLAAGVGHEINNPLTYVIANLEMVLEDLTEMGADELSPLVQDALVGANRIKDIVRDLRVFAQSGETMERRPLDLRAMVDTASTLVRHELHHRARLARDYGDIPMVMGNETRVVQVFVNLLVNAAHAIGAGSTLENEIVARSFTTDQGEAAIEIRDTGSGISPEHRARIFEPFFTTKAKQHGTGLGLAVCHSIVTAAGGRIEIESEVGVGTAVTVILPATDEHEVAVLKQTPELVSSYGHARVLVIDDDRLVGLCAKRYLRHYDVILLDNGRDALQFIEKGEPIDVIFCDLMMPDLTGMDIFAEACDLRPELKSKFTFWTGGAFAPETIAFIEQLSTPCLSKPFKAKELIAIVEAMIAR